MKTPNYTQIPNIIMDEYMMNLTGAELRILIAICRKTIGWHKETSEAISYSQLEKMTGLVKASISAATKTLEEKKIIIIEKKEGKCNKYLLNMTTSKIEQVVKLTTPKIEQDYTKNHTGTTPKIEHTKERTKETNKRKIHKKPVQHRHGDKVLLSDEQYKALCDKYEKTVIDKYIGKVNDYCVMHGKTYKDYKRGIETFIRRDKERGSFQSAPIKDSGWKCKACGKINYNTMSFCMDCNEDKGKTQ